jgi:hypothetical protein
MPDILFGRDGPIIVGLDLLRGLRKAASRLMVILGASGAGKFLLLAGWPAAKAYAREHLACHSAGARSAQR